MRRYQAATLGDAYQAWLALRALLRKREGGGGEALRATALTKLSTLTKRRKATLASSRTRRAPNFMQEANDKNATKPRFPLMRKAAPKAFVYHGEDGTLDEKKLTALAQLPISWAVYWFVEGCAETWGWLLARFDNGDWGLHCLYRNDACDAEDARVSFRTASTLAMLLNQCDKDVRREIAPLVKAAYATPPR